MKKITFCLMAFAVAMATMFSSCHKDGDDDDDENNIMNLSATCGSESFSTSKAGFYQSSKNSSNTGTSVLDKIFTSSSDGTTTIAGAEKGKQLCINVNGTKSGTYELSVASDQTINNALIDLLSGKSAKEIVSNSVKTDAMIIYRATGESEGGATYYFSTKATVSINFDLVLYSTGSFTATLMNKSGDTFTINDGKFKVFGKPSLNGSK
ncbi:MAG: hypothetical protein II075_11795 [Bacteroidales bacterium]|nr:hypothetical protein [Bacteroidales bacterium]